MLLRSPKRLTDKCRGITKYTNALTRVHTAALGGVSSHNINFNQIFQSESLTGHVEGIVVPVTVLDNLASHCSRLLQ